MNKLFGLVVIVVLLAGVIGFFFAERVLAPEQAELLPQEDTVLCTMDAMQCPDGSYVGRTGPECEFLCPASAAVPSDVAESIAALSDRIVVMSPEPMAEVTSPLVITGEARGPWFFEASFPITLTNWDGLIIAEGIATADGDWMTTEFVPFTATLTFTSPYQVGDASFMERGSLILKKDNPSGLPENDAALEFPVRFAPSAATQE
jgi:hypothetical protein